MNRAKTTATRGKLIVFGAIRVYPIEPARHDHGLTRVEMVDRHLAQLVEHHARHSDVDVLLDARNGYTMEDQ